ncbi:MAG: hypothetical protein IPP74_10340 [Alphaproteobacteria bacterium]|nr:hypothetical protein [Alphaproteobacteria bacterium]
MGKRQKNKKKQKANAKPPMIENNNAINPSSQAEVAHHSGPNHTNDSDVGVEIQQALSPSPYDLELIEYFAHSKEIYLTHKKKRAALFSEFQKKRGEITAYHVDMRLFQQYVYYLKNWEQETHESIKTMKAWLKKLPLCNLEPEYFIERMKEALFLQKIIHIQLQQWFLNKENRPLIEVNYPAFIPTLLVYNELFTNLISKLADLNFDTFVAGIHYMASAVNPEHQALMEPFVSELLAQMNTRLWNNFTVVNHSLVHQPCCVYFNPSQQQSFLELYAMILSYRIQYYFKPMNEAGLKGAIEASDHWVGYLKSQNIDQAPAFLLWRSVMHLLTVESLLAARNSDEAASRHRDFLAMCDQADQSPLVASPQHDPLGHDPLRKFLNQSYVLVIQAYQKIDHFFLVQDATKHDDMFKLLDSIASSGTLLLNSLKAIAPNKIGTMYQLSAFQCLSEQDWNEQLQELSKVFYFRFGGSTIRTLFKSGASKAVYMLICNGLIAEILAIKQELALEQRLKVQNQAIELFKMARDIVSNVQRLGVRDFLAMNYDSSNGKDPGFEIVPISDYIYSLSENISRTRHAKALLLKHIDDAAQAKSKSAELAAYDKNFEDLLKSFGKHSNPNSNPKRQSHQNRGHHSAGKLLKLKLAKKKSGSEAPKPQIQTIKEQSTPKRKQEKVTDENLDPRVDDLCHKIQPLFQSKKYAQIVAIYELEYEKIMKEQPGDHEYLAYLALSAAQFVYLNATQKNRGEFLKKIETAVGYFEDSLYHIDHIQATATQSVNRLQLAMLKDEAKEKIISLNALISEEHSAAQTRFEEAKKLRRLFVIELGETILSKDGKDISSLSEQDKFASGLQRFRDIGEEKRYHYLFEHWLAHHPNQPCLLNHEELFAYGKTQKVKTPASEETKYFRHCTVELQRLNRLQDRSQALMPALSLAV